MSLAPRAASAVPRRRLGFQHVKSPLLFRQLAIPRRPLTNLGPSFAQTQLPLRPVQRRFASGFPPQRQYRRFDQRSGSYGRQSLDPSTRRYILIIAAAGGAIFYVANLEKVPISGRWRFRIVSQQGLADEGQRAYQQIMQQYRSQILSDYAPQTQTVKRVLRRLIPYSHLEGEQWEVHVIDDAKTRNAFVLPGGKVFVFTGILPVCKNDDGIATVLGHEIAHNVLEHAAEKQSTEFLYSIFAILVNTFIGPNPFTDAGTSLLLRLPNSRTQEKEADHYGLMLMSEACYDPKEAPPVWERMSKAEKHAESPFEEFFSTHPASSSRIIDMRKWLPEAENKRADSNCASTIGFADQFKRLSMNEPGMQTTRQPVCQPQRPPQGKDDYPF